jgi:hypothetical protein
MSVPDPWGVLGVAPGSSLAAARAARRRLAKQLHPDVDGGQVEAMTEVNRALAQIERLAGAEPASVAPAQPTVAQPAGSLDPDSFSVEWLPAEAFEALFLAAYGLGDILVADEPYLLELFLAEPPCFCHLTLVPEAGGSLVTVEVTPPADALAAPTPAAVIEVLVAELNALIAG